MTTKFIPGRTVEVFVPAIQQWLPGMIVDRRGNCLIERRSHEIYGGCRIARATWTRLREPEYRKEYCDVDE